MFEHDACCIIAGFFIAIIINTSKAISHFLYFVSLKLLKIHKTNAHIRQVGLFHILYKLACLQASLSL